MGWEAERFERMGRMNAVNNIQRDYRIRGFNAVGLGDVAAGPTDCGVCATPRSSLVGGGASVAEGGCGGRCRLAQ